VHDGDLTVGSTHRRRGKHVVVAVSSLRRDLTLMDVDLGKLDHARWGRVLLVFSRPEPEVV
jgi:hypothetical protein